jgi:hypothetical protein
MTAPETLLASRPSRGCRTLSSLTVAILAFGAFAVLFAIVLIVLFRSNRR